MGRAGVHQNAPLARIIIMIQDNYNKLLFNLKQKDVPAGLYDLVFKQIYQRQRFMILRRKIIYGLGLIFSALAFIPTVLSLKTGLVESGFTQYFSLLFSDFNVVSAYWQSFLLTLLESLPIISLAVFLAVLLIFLELLKLSVRKSKVIFS